MTVARERRHILTFRSEEEKETVLKNLRERIRPSGGGSDSEIMATALRRAAGLGNGDSPGTREK